MKVADLLSKPKTRMVSVRRGGRLKRIQLDLHVAANTTKRGFASVHKRLDEIDESIEFLYARTLTGRIERFRAFVSRVVLSIRRRIEKVVTR